MSNEFYSELVRTIRSNYLQAYVMDMNMLQDEGLATRVKHEPNSRFIIPEVAFVEMCKHKNCHLTMKLALQNFFDQSERVLVSISVPEALRRELGSFCGMRTEQLLSVGFTDFVHQLIVDLAKNDEETDTLIQGRFEAERDRLLAQDLNAVEAKKTSEKLMGLARDGLMPQVATALRKPGLDWTRFLSLVQWMAENLFRHTIKNKNKYISEANLRRFLNEKPMYLRYYYVLVRHALLALRNGGNISAMKAERELNNHLDMDYVMIASYFDGILSSDRNVVDADRDLRTILSNPSAKAEECVAIWFHELGLK